MQMPLVVVAYFLLSVGISAYDGQLDPTFGTGGIVVPDFGGASSAVESITIQSDGKIVVAGYVDLAGSRNIAIARFNPNGTRDLTFNAQGPIKGVLTVHFAQSSLSIAQASAIQSDGKIVAAGYVNTLVDQLVTPNFGLIRSNQNGTLDHYFSSGGGTITYFEDGGGYANALAIQSDGKIVAAGTAINNGYHEIALVRYNTDGSLDTSFNGNGAVITDLGNPAQAAGIALQTDNKIVVTGFIENTNSVEFIIARYTTDGQLDVSFNAHGPMPGVVIGDFGGITDTARDVVLQDDGSIVIVGASAETRRPAFALARYTTNGTIDASFNPYGPLPGTLITDLAGDSVATSLALQKDGKIVASGFAQNSPCSYTFAIARYHPDGSLDESFGHGCTTGAVITNLLAGNNYATALAIQDDGKLLVAGYSGFESAITRYIGQTNATYSTLLQAQN